MPYEFKTAPYNGVMCLQHVRDLTGNPIPVSAEASSSARDGENRRWGFAVVITAFLWFGVDKSVVNGEWLPTCKNSINSDYPLQFLIVVVSALITCLSRGVFRRFEIGPYSIPPAAFTRFGDFLIDTAFEDTFATHPPYGNYTEAK